MNDLEFDLKSALSVEKLKRKAQLLAGLCHNTELIELLELMIIDNPGVISYNKNINTDIVYGEIKGIHNFLMMLNRTKFEQEMEMEANNQ